VRFGALLEESTRLSRTVVEPLRFSAPVASAEREELLSRSADGRRFLEISSYSALDFVKESFASEELRALLLFASALRGYLPVLDVPGTGYVVAQAITGLVNCLICEGGSYELGRALAAQIYRCGGRTIAGDRVETIRVRSGRAVGVELAGGAVISARRAVVSNVPAPQTLVDLIGREHLDSSLVDAMTSYPWNGEALFGAHLALSEAPDFGDSTEGARALNLCLGYESSADVERDIAEVRRGEIPSFAALHASVPTRSDPSQAPPGMHTAFGWQFVPSRPEGETAEYWTEDRSHRQLAQMVETWRRYAPNVADAEMARAAHSPLDTQNHLASMLHGDRHGGLYHPDNFYENRPASVLSDYRTPIDGLYLCGATSHPGGSVNGLPGYNAAGVVVDDLGVDKWWKPTDAREWLATLTDG
jgi:phytoene dehydrogenase-like protein